MEIATKCIQEGWKPGNGQPRQLPIIESTTFQYDSSEQMGRLFDLQEEGYFYTRPMILSRRRSVRLRAEQPLC